jgi:hypothetical protein
MKTGRCDGKIAHALHRPGQPVPEHGPRSGRGSTPIVARDVRRGRPVRRRPTLGRPHHPDFIRLLPGEDETSRSEEAQAHRILPARHPRARRGDPPVAGCVRRSSPTWSPGIRSASTALRSPRASSPSTRRWIAGRPAVARWPPSSSTIAGKMAGIATSRRRPSRRCSPRSDGYVVAGQQELPVADRHRRFESDAVDRGRRERFRSQRRHRAPPLPVSHAFHSAHRRPCQRSRCAACSKRHRAAGSRAARSPPTSPATGTPPSRTRSTRSSTSSRRQISSRRSSGPPRPSACTSDGRADVRRVWPEARAVRVHRQPS